MGDWEDDYAETVGQIKAKAEEKEQAWANLTDDNRVLMFTFPSVQVNNVAYRAMGWKPTADYNFREGCPRCKGQEISTREISAGCRRNGDGYGSVFYICQTCGLFDWYSYDEA